MAGLTPTGALYVNYGMWMTMTTQDLLEGRIILQVGLATLPLAEFSILQLTFNLNVSQVLK